MGESGVPARVRARGRKITVGDDFLRLRARRPWQSNGRLCQEPELKVRAK